MEPEADPTVPVRLEAVERRLDALEAARSAAARSPAPGHPATGDDELPWLLRQLREREQLPDGSVIFAGEVQIGGRHALYQWQRPARALADEPWDEHLERLAAIAHPVRGAVLRRLLASPATAAELVGEGIVSSAGAAYHHLGGLAAGGWTAKDARGRHSVRTARIVPLLTIIAAAGDH